MSPQILVTLFFSTMYITRRRNFSIRRKRSHGSSDPLLDDHDGTPSPRSSHEFELLPKPTPHPPKTRWFMGLWRIQTPNSSRFARHWHSRVLQKFPFLIEMFYWLVSFLFYRLTIVLAQAYYGGHKTMWDSATNHGLILLEAEAYFWSDGYQGPQRWVEWRIQRFFLHGAQIGDYRAIWLTILNRGYALIHIPGTVGFLGYYYTMSPTHSRFCTVRRTMTLTNFLAFAIFVLIPTCPPRLLPEKYGFVDTVNLESAESVWMSGDAMNKLAAFPSMHFGYAFCIGCVFVADSGVLNGLFARVRRYALRGSDNSTYDSDNEEDINDNVIRQRRPFVRACMFAFGIWYPLWILLTIVGTANHYFLDAFAAIFTVLAAYLFNRIMLVFLPAEDWLLWAWRLEKPIPTTGRKKNLAVE